MIWYLFLATALAASSMVGKQWLISLRREPGRIAIVLVWCMVYRRIQVFNTMLLQGGTAEENCYKVGFQNYSNFYRLYKKHMGISPSQLKKETKTSFRTI